jgi:hypothetical protein
VSKFILLNSAFITLLPKANAIEVKDYCPISLVHSFARLVTKLMANHLASRLPDMVSINQSAFDKGRSIHDNFLLVQQLARCLFKKKEPHILFMLDISKVSDSVSWAFLLEVLQNMGFGRKWRNLMCLFSPPPPHKFWLMVCLENPFCIIGAEARGSFIPNVVLASHGSTECLNH